MFEAILVAGLGAGLFATYTRTRDYVRNRLRFVDAAQGRRAPWVAGTVAALAAASIVALTPLGGGPVLPLALGGVVLAGVKKGQRQVRQLTGG
ncbi:MAG: hypothetical protein V3U67_10195 [Gemmatimonadota bacterium]